jgi:hypothetical protein
MSDEKMLRPGSGCTNGGNAGFPPMREALQCSKSRLSLQFRVTAGNRD